ncbi:MAG: T9SS type A sorting domain-containing protein [Bacteroidales bacterium]|nr:T9SS type A sorting domain-containing protein [Bacteroidales bacterium]
MTKRCTVTCFLVLFFSYALIEGQDFQWAFGAGGSSSEAVNSIATDNQGNVIIAGNLGSTDTDFDPGAGEEILSTNGYSDILFAKYDLSGNLLWAKNMGGSQNEQANNVKVDNTGNIYLCGEFSSSSIDLDPGNTNAVFYNQGGSDIFFAKYDSDGNYIWAQTIGGNSTDVATAMAVDAEGAIYLTGSFAGSMIDFDPGPDVFNMSSFGAMEDIFIAKYNTNSQRVWSWRIGGDGTDQGTSIKLDPSGNVCFAGSFEGLSVDFNPSSGSSALLSSSGGSDVFYAKFTNSGTYTYAKSIGGSSNDMCESLTVDAQGNIVIAGEFAGDNIDFDPNSNNTAYLSSWGSNIDLFFAKYNATGEYVWAKKITGVSDEFIGTCGLDSDGNVYITGSFAGTNVDFDPGTSVQYLSSNGDFDVFLSKYSSEGDLDWAYKLGGVGSDIGQSVYLPDDNTIYLAGRFAQTDVDFDPGAGTHYLNSNGFQDFFLAKYDITTSNAEQILSDIDVKVYSSGNRVYIISNENTKLNYSITNLIGQKLFAGVIDEMGTLHQAISDNGMYIINIQKDTKIFSTKILIY